MLYTSKGDLGDTGLYGCDQRISKSSAVAEALGTSDEVNSFLGLCKIKAEKDNDKKISNIIHEVQENLFMIQSQIAGSDKKISDEKIDEMERMIDEMEKELPEIKSFCISGGTELSACLDFARTLARRAERRVVAVQEEGLVKIDNNTLKYLNRSSSLLYVLARLANAKNGEEEQSPKY